MGYDFDLENPQPGDKEMRGVNIWGMKYIRELLVSVLDDTPAPPWSELSEKARFADDNKLRHEELRATLEAVSEDTSKVPRHKFCSNDGWLVNPRQCIVLADELAAKAPAEEKEWLGEIVSDWRLAAERGGFRVY